MSSFGVGLAMAACLWASQAAALTVFAAASLKDALDAVAASYSDATGADIRVSYAGSSALARQIAAGAPADVFVSASEDWMDAVADRLVPGSRVDLLTNRLVLVGPVDAPAADLADALGGDGRVAMAFVDAVPAGIYGQAALEHLGLWDAVRPRVVEADSVRAALALVAVGAAPLGIVYATDAEAERQVAIVALIPEDSHPPILYPAAAIAGGDEDGAADFLAFLGGDRARALFRAAGFGQP